MALELESQGDYISRPIKIWTCHAIDEFPVESEILDIPHGSLIKLIAKPDFIIYTYDEIAKEWFQI
jgi:hypothetical protein